eukprot:scaffold7052_cov254-Pinguiococcus_pyrenoidosus.AAC.60
MRTLYCIGVLVAATALPCQALRTPQIGHGQPFGGQIGLRQGEKCRLQRQTGPEDRGSIKVYAERSSTLLGTKKPHAFPPFSWLQSAIFGSVEDDKDSVLSIFSRESASKLPSKSKSKPEASGNLNFQWDATLVAILVVYFVQGALGLASLTSSLFLKDELGLSPGDMAALTGAAAIPWVLKPLYGAITDNVAIFQLRRRPYLVGAGILGFSGFAALATVVSSPSQALAAGVCYNLGIAFSDVVVDSLCVERARKEAERAVLQPGQTKEELEQEVAGKLQSLCWGSRNIGSVCTAAASGPLLAALAPRQVYGLTAVFPLMAAAAGLLANETPVSAPANGLGGLAKGNPFAELLQTVRRREIVVPVAVVALVTPSSGSAFFYFLTNEVGLGPTQVRATKIEANHKKAPSCPSSPKTPSPIANRFSCPPLPLFLAQLQKLGKLQLLSSVASLLGVVAYRTLFAKAKPSTVIAFASIVSVPLGLLQLLLVTHQNQQLGKSTTTSGKGKPFVPRVIGVLVSPPGIPDGFLIYGDDVFLSALSELAFMPTLTLAARLCPPGQEGTFFALLMSIYNASGILGSEVSAALTKTLGIEGNNFQMLPMLIVICNVASLLPLPFLRFLDEGDDDAEAKKA